MTNLIKYIIDNNMQNEDFSGEVLWYSQRDKNGIMLVGENNHEVYFDSSVLQDKSYTPKRGDLVEFNFNINITGCNCGKNIRKI